ncbi:MAG: hypothetical protein JO309_07300 [Pseudonocardiales bacterium]|nr:hypothetical protein [Pseudonocardiales bacterium]MBV9729195.1 hypothetical protein [Pseudonocardiales bacterium]
MSESNIAKQRLLVEVDALVAAIMGDAPLSEVVPIVDRIGAAVDHWHEIPPAAIAELRSAIDLLYGGHACATLSALLSAHSELTRPGADPTPR